MSKKTLTKVIVEKDIVGGSSESPNIPLDNRMVCVMFTKDMFANGENYIKGITYWFSSTNATKYIEGGYCVRQK